NRDGSWLAVGQWPGATGRGEDWLWLWQLRGDGPHHENSEAAEISTFKLDVASNRLLLSDRSGTRVWNLRAATLTTPRLVTESPVVAAAFANDGEDVALVDRNGAVAIWRESDK